MTTLLLPVPSWIAQISLLIEMSGLSEKVKTWVAPDATLTPGFDPESPVSVVVVEPSKLKKQSVSLMLRMYSARLYVYDRICAAEVVTVAFVIM